MELFFKNAYELSEMIRNKEISSRELTESVINRIEAVEDRVEAYTTLTKDNAIKTAIEIDNKIQRGESVAPLAGIPIGIKDT